MFNVKNFLLVFLKRGVAKAFQRSSLDDYQLGNTTARCFVVKLRGRALLRATPSPSSAATGRSCSVSSSKTRSTSRTWEVALVRRRRTSARPWERLARCRNAWRNGRLLAIFGPDVASGSIRRHRRSASEGNLARRGFRSVFVRRAFYAPKARESDLKRHASRHFARIRIKSTGLDGVALSTSPGSIFPNSPLAKMSEHEEH